MSKYIEAKKAYLAWRAEFGTSVCDSIVKGENRRRLEGSGREKRKRVSHAKMVKMFFQQHGKCALCGDQLPTDFKGVEVDHVDPNREDFNAPGNLQLACSGCNREKGAKSIMEQAKFYGRPVTSILHSESTE
jgi:5-methylcytosine-specific restriction endonuclease McrA